MRSRSRAAPAASWLAVLMLGAADADALSLRSTRAEAFLGEASPGRIVVFARRTGEPLGLVNTGTEPAFIEASVGIPPPAKLMDGCDALADPKWVRVKGAGRTLSPGETLELDVSIAVPKDARHGQRQFDLLLSGKSPGGSALKMSTRLTFAVGEGDPPALDSSPPEGFDVSPRAGKADQVPLGRRVALRASEAGGLKLINAGEKDLRTRLATSREWPDGIRPPEGYGPAPDPRWLKTGPEVKVPAGAVREAALEIEVPREARYAGRKWSFLVALDAEGGGTRGRKWFVMSVTTGKLE